MSWRAAALFVDALRNKHGVIGKYIAVILVEALGAWDRLSL